MINKIILCLLKRAKFLVLLILLFSAFTYANSNIPRLLKSLEKMELGINYVDTLSELAFLYTKSDLDSAAIYAEKAYQLSETLKYELGKSNSLIVKGILAEYKGGYSNAISFYNQALKIRIELKDIPKIASCYNNIGLCHYYQNDIAEAIKNFQQGLNFLYQQSPPPSIKGHLYNSISNAYVFDGAYTEAVIYLDSSFHIWNQINDDYGKARVLSSRANLYIDLENWEASKSDFESSLKLYEGLQDKQGIASSYIGMGNLNYYDKDNLEASNFYNRALEFKEAMSEQDLANLYHNMGSISQEKKDWKNAISWYDKSLTNFSKINDTYGLAVVNLELGNIYKQQANNTKAKDFYLKCLEYAEFESDAYTKALLANNLSEVYLQLGQKDFALKYSQLHNNLRDSIYSNKMEASSYQLNLEKEKKIISDLKLEVSEANSKNLFQIGIFSVLALASVLTFFVFRNNYNKQRVLLADYKTEQAYKEIDDLLREKELEIAYARLNAKDKIQSQIGQDLHDRLGVMLSTIKLYFNEFSQQLNRLQIDTSQKQHKTIELLDEAVEEVRRISNDMQSGVLKKFGLISAIQDLADTINNADQIQIKVYSFGLKQRIPNQLEIKIYKIIQELISNALKHAQAKSASVSLHRQDESLNLIVEDDGIGFLPDAVMDKGGMGLKNIAFRVSELDGHCHFDSGKGKGTRVIIDIPIKETF